MPSNAKYHYDVIIFALFFVLLSTWSINLPSGSNWRPATAIFIAGIFILPTSLTPLVALPGLILITALDRKPLWAYALTLGHVALGLYIGSAVFWLLAPTGLMHFPRAFFAAVVTLCVHIIVNRFIAAANLAYQRRKPLLRQIAAITREVNWGHVNGHLMGLVIAVMYYMEGFWGFSLAALLLVGMYKSASYYNHMYAWQKAAQTDGLTEVGNRTAWEAFYAKLKTRPINGTLIMIDLDNFKTINDNMGHSVGDVVLKEVGIILRSNVRKSDKIFRYGGDEFILFFPHEREDDGWVAERVNTITSEIRQKCKTYSYGAGASVGTAFLSAEVNNVDEILALADARMYKAKHMRKEVQAPNC
ncbi:MAG: GGDEF domain-containing protein [Peptococcaceae bacterium]|nr:GGDEF domain-containing protein [Peptococcaceae bacterium]